MALPDLLRLRRRADKVLFVAWLNLAVTAVVCFLMPDRVAAIVIGCVWASLVSIAAVVVAQHIDRKDSRAER